MGKRLRSVTLGQEVFVIEQDEVVRTMIGKITNTGYILLNGDCPQHWFSFTEARVELDKRLAKKQEELRTILCRLAKKRMAVWGAAYKQAVLSAPYKVVDLRDDPVERRRVRKSVCAPKEYLCLGTKVFVPVTVDTRLLHEGIDCYRPYAYFVLETMVRGVCFRPNSEVCYSFSTPYRVEDMYLSKSEAEARLQKIVGLDVEENLYFVSHREEEEFLKSLLLDSPF